ncbi:MAG: adenine-specific methyltransferase EcoRI family protein [Planctomycetaceae bacterium]|nr:adenine-specific methyltransferase EcoRI family protein [Planctomycetaceae bacterium]
MSKRKGSNSPLISAKKARNDEFYTLMPDIVREVSRYTSQLKGKVIFCNCDDPSESNFFLYFVERFKELKLKKLITTHYKAEGKSYKIEIANGKIAEKIAETIRRGHDFNSLGVIKPLQGNGDFRSDECIELLKQVDVVVTNPPFSLFREYVAQLIEYGKQFLIVGNDNCRTYKECFKLIKENKIWCGYSRIKEFRQPDGTMKHFGNIGWYTNLDVSSRHEELTPYKFYTPEEYPVYDNYDAIEVSKVSDIPVDYDGAMGVPITFLDKYNPNQFEILGLDHHDPEKFGAQWHILNGRTPYRRIIIRKKV